MAGPRKIGDILGAVLARRNYGQLTAQMELEKSWRSVAGEQVAKLTTIGPIRRGVLEILVDSAPLLAELEGFRKEELTEAMSAQVTHSKITGIKFRRR